MDYFGYAGRRPESCEALVTLWSHFGHNAFVTDYAGFLKLCGGTEDLDFAESRKLGVVVCADLTDVVHSHGCDDDEVEDVLTRRFVLSKQTKHGVSDLRAGV